MALSEDQRALLQLLLAGDTYEQVADLLGTGPGEVRTRARDALGALEREPQAELPPDAVQARLAALEGAPAAAAPGPPPAGGTAGGPRRWALWVAAGAAALLLVIVLLVTSSGGGGGGSTPTQRGEREEVVPIKLRPVGSKASGTIAIVRVADQPAVDLAIRGLRPTGSGQSYVLWFVGSGGRSLPVAFQAVGSDGQLTGRTPIPSAAVGLLPSFDTAELTLTRRREAASAVQQAAQSGTLPQPVGTIVLRGPLR